MAMMLSPPGLFSTTTGWPHLACSFSASSRAPISAPAPGPNGTMNRTERVGQLCACAGAGATSGVAKRATAAASKDFIESIGRFLKRLNGWNAKHFIAETQRFQLRRNGRAWVVRGRLLRENQRSHPHQRVPLMDAKTVDARTHQFDVQDIEY